MAAVAKTATNPTKNLLSMEIPSPKHRLIAFKISDALMSGQLSGFFLSNCQNRGWKGTRSCFMEALFLESGYTKILIIFHRAKARFYQGRF
jgi:hypothetical protein